MLIGIKFNDKFERGEKPSFPSSNPTKKGKEKKGEITQKANKMQVRKKYVERKPVDRATCLLSQL